MLKRFLHDDPLPAWRAALTLRSVYALSFMGQVVVAVVVAAAVRLLAGGTPRPNDLLAWVLVVLALLQMPFAALVLTRLGGLANRQGALTRTLFSATLLASTAWFTALALATGQRGTAVYVLLVLVLFAYGIGFLATSRLAAKAAGLPSQGATSSGGAALEGAASGGAASGGAASGGAASTLEAGVLEDVDHVERLGGA